MPLELAAGMELQSVDLSDATFTRRDDNPASRDLLGSERSSGASFGVGRASLAGATIALSTFLIRHVTFGMRFSMFGQTDRNGFAPQSGDRLYTTHARVIEAGADAGLILPLGLVTLRAELYAGTRRVYFRVQDLGLTDDTARPEIESRTVFLRPRATVMVNLTPRLGLGAYGGMDPLRPGDFQVGVLLGLHTPDFAMPQ